MQTRILVTTAVMMGFAAILAGCETTAEPGSSKPTVAATTKGPTYHKDVVPLLVSKCQGCHVSGGIAPFALATYAQAKAMAKSMVVSTQNQTMPPWSARETPECKPRLPFRHDLRLSTAELAVLKEWSVNGAPEGDVADAPKGLTPPSVVLGKVDATAVPKLAYPVEGDADQLRCFVLDTTFAERKYLSGMQIVPGNTKVVHHVLVFTAPKSDVAKKKLDAHGSYECFGGAGLDAPQLVAAWAPGSMPLEYPADAGAVLEKDTQLVMQVHYHPTGTTGQTDLTQVQIRYSQTVPAWTGFTALIGNIDSQGKNGMGLQPDPDDRAGKVEFRIPAGMKDHKETMRVAIPGQLDGKAMPDLHVFGVGTHMHYVGRNMRIEVDRSHSHDPACTSAQLQPLSVCVQKYCFGQTGAALATCAMAQCQAAAEGLTTACGDCLQDGILKPDATDSKVFATCTQPPPAPAGAAQPDQECLLETPAWDFNWQRVYNYDAALEALPILRPGDELRLTCQYDNSLSNPFVQLALAQQKLSQPIDVVLGETTLDEMCLSVLQILYKTK